MDTLWTNYFSENEIQNIDDYIDNYHISKPGIEKTNYSDISNTNPYETNLDQFMNYWNKDHELGYLNLKLPKNIDENHLKFFFKLWSKNKGRRRGPGQGHHVARLCGHFELRRGRHDVRGPP